VTWPTAKLQAAYMPSGEDRDPTAYVVAEPGPEYLAADQGKEPRHGQAPDHQGASGEDLALLAEQSQCARGRGGLAGGEGGDGQRSSGDPVVTLPAKQPPQVEPADGEDIEREPEQQEENSRRTGIRSTAQAIPATASSAAAATR